MKPLEAAGLHTFYGRSHILHGVGLEVNEGEIVALLGRNGAGKTTTLRSIMGLTPAREGSVKIFGKEARAMPTFRIAELGVGYVPEGRRIFPNLTVEDNLMVPLVRPGNWTIDRVFKFFPSLAERRRNLGRQLSGGEQEMLSIGRALLLNPRLLLLDEPSQGLAPLIVKEVFRIIAAMREEGISVLVVEQNVRVSLGIADRAYVLDDGKIVYSGSAAELAGDEERVRAMAGASAGSAACLRYRKFRIRPASSGPLRDRVRGRFRRAACARAAAVNFDGVPAGTDPVAEAGQARARIVALARCWTTTRRSARTRWPALEFQGLTGVGGGLADRRRGGGAAGAAGPGRRSDPDRRSRRNAEVDPSRACTMSTGCSVQSEDDQKCVAEFRDLYGVAGEQGRRDQRHHRQGRQCLREHRQRHDQDRRHPARPRRRQGR